VAYKNTTIYNKTSPKKTPNRAKMLQYVLRNKTQKVSTTEVSQKIKNLQNLQ